MKRRLLYNQTRSFYPVVQVCVCLMALDGSLDVSLACGVFSIFYFVNVFACVFLLLSLWLLSRERKL